MFRGVCTALVTPFDKNGNIDFETYENFIEFQINNNVDALLVCGTTGEPSTMDSIEKETLIKFTIQKVNKRVPVIVGCGSNNTKSAIEQAKKAEEYGADALLIVTPYYNKCNQDGIFEHYYAINNVVNTPIIIYNVPGRTGVNIQPNTVIKLAKLKNIKAIKEASGNIDQINKLSRKLVNNNVDLILYSGDDSITLPILSLGAKGVISVASNIIPKQMHELVISYLENDIKTAKSIHNKYGDLMDTLFIDVNPIPIKEACNLLNLMNNDVRLPLTKLSNEKKIILLNTMKELKII